MKQKMNILEEENYNFTEMKMYILEIHFPWPVATYTEVQYFQGHSVHFNS